MYNRYFYECQLYTKIHILNWVSYLRGSHTKRFTYTGEVPIHRGDPHTEEVHIQRRSTYRGGPHTEEVLIQRRPTYRGGPHTKEVHIQRRFSYRGDPHTEEVPIKKKSPYRVIHVQYIIFICVQ